MIAYQQSCRDITPRAREPSATSLLLNGAAISTRIVPAGNARNGGDWCEAWRLSSTAVALSIGDVCGHGENVFSEMRALRRCLHDAANRGLSPSKALGVASSFMRSIDVDLHATSVFAVLDTKARTLTFSNAGHPPPLLGGAQKSRFLEFRAFDVPLGVATDRLPAEHTVELPHDALIVLYTDGVTERDRDILKGEQQLLGAASFAHQCRALPGASVIERQMFLRGSNEDDAAILTARI